MFYYYGNEFVTNTLKNQRVQLISGDNDVYRGNTIIISICNIFILRSESDNFNAAVCSGETRLRIKFEHTFWGNYGLNSAKKYIIYINSDVTVLIIIEQQYDYKR